jgi:1,4-dihydroxy-2-naphthoyl-CoA hydrolase
MTKGGFFIPSFFVIGESGLIWYQNYTLTDLSKGERKTMVSHLGIKFTDLGDDYLEGSMPVDYRTQQPFGLLHGGASCVLGETLGSVASNLVIDHEKFYAVGQSLTAHHLKSAKDGHVVGVCSAIHLGRSSHIWDINIFNQDKSLLICRVTLTTAIRPAVK